MSRNSWRVSLIFRNKLKILELIFIRKLRKFELISQRGLKIIPKKGMGNFKTLIMNNETSPLIPSNKHNIKVCCPVEEEKELIRKSPPNHVALVKKVLNKSESLQYTMKEAIEVVKVNSLL